MQMISITKLICDKFMVTISTRLSSSTIYLTFTSHLPTEVNEMVVDSETPIDANQHLINLIKDNQKCYKDDVIEMIKLSFNAWDVA